MRPWLICGSWFTIVSALITGLLRGREQEAVFLIYFLNLAMCAEMILERHDR